MTAEQFLIDLKAIVDAGLKDYDATAHGVLLGGASFFVSTPASQDSDPYLE